MDLSEIIRVTGLTVDLPTASGWIHPVDGVSFNLAVGETLAIVGESGSGKTMLSLSLIGLLPRGARTRGEIRLAARAEPSQALPSPNRNLLSASERELRAIRGREIAMIFQEPLSALNPVMRIGVQIEEAIRAHGAAMSRDEVRARSLEAMHFAAIPEPQLRASQYPHQLSGGLRQRAMIAMALAPRPRVLIADEPTTALDSTVQKQILDLLARLRDELRLSIIFITHDLAVAGVIADRVAVMHAGEIVESGPAREILTHPRQRYTKNLLRAAPRLQREAPAS